MTCVATCTQCTDYPIECFACDNNQENPIGSCEPYPTAYCLTGSYQKSVYAAMARHCDCGMTTPAAASQCPSQQHVCIPVSESGESTEWCVTCGETLTGPAAGMKTQDLPCKIASDQCDAAASLPHCVPK